MRLLIKWWRKVLHDESGDVGQMLTPPKPDTPQAASAAEMTKEAVEAELESGPELARQRQELAEELSPRASELQLELMQEYGPDLGSAIFEARRELAPALTDLETQTAETIAGRLGETDEDLLESYRREFRAAEAGAGRLGAPVGSVNLARQTIRAREAIRQSRINEALSATGKVPVTAAPQTQPITPNTQSQFLSPMLGYGAQTYGAQTAAQAQLGAARMKMQGKMMGAGMGALGTMGGALLGAE